MAEIARLAPNLLVNRSVEGSARRIASAAGGWIEEEYLVLTDHGNGLARVYRRLRGSSIRNGDQSACSVSRGDAYEESGTYRRGQSAPSELLAGFSVDVGAVFDAE